MKENEDKPNSSLNDFNIDNSQNFIKINNPEKILIKLPQDENKKEDEEKSEVEKI